MRSSSRSGRPCQPPRWKDWGPSLLKHVPSTVTHFWPLEWSPKVVLTKVKMTLKNPPLLPLSSSEHFNVGALLLFDENLTLWVPGGRWGQHKPTEVYLLSSYESEGNITEGHISQSMVSAGSFDRTQGLSEMQILSPSPQAPREPWHTLFEKHSRKSRKASLPIRGLDSNPGSAN